MKKFILIYLEGTNIVVSIDNYWYSTEVSTSSSTVEVMATEIGVIIGLFFGFVFFFLPKLAVTINVHREEVRLCISDSQYIL